MRADMPYHVRMRQRTQNGKVSDWSPGRIFITAYGPPDSQILEPSNGTSGDMFGTSVAISGNGEHWLSTAPLADRPVSASGSVYFYDDVEGVSSQVLEYFNTPGQVDLQLGLRSSISSDGQYAAIYAASGSPATSSYGRVFIFKRNGLGVWDFEIELANPSPAEGDRFGESLAINGDGSVVVIGIPYEDTWGTAAGGLMVFTRSGNIWTLRHHVNTPDAAENNLLGVGVDISQDGRTVVACTTATLTPKVYVFELSGDFLTIELVYTGTSNAGSSDRAWGSSLAICGNGNVIAVGCRFSNDSGTFSSGAVQLFRRVDGVWGRDGRLFSNAPQSVANFGQSLSFSKNGDRMVVSAPGQDSFTGKIYMFRYLDGAWVLRGSHVPADALPGHSFGHSVKMNDDGSVVLASATGRGVAGSVYRLVF